MKHILLIHQAFAALDEAGGTRHIEMARHLVEQGDRVTIIASQVSYLTGKSGNSSSLHAEKSELYPGITLIRTYTYPALHRSFVHRIISFLSFMLSSFIAGLQVRAVDVVWGTSPPIFQSFTAWLISRIKRIPFLMEVRDLWPAFAIAVGVLRSPILIRASLWLEYFLYSNADVVMVNSPGYVEHVQQRGARKVELIPNGVDPDMFTSISDGSEFKNQHHLTDQFIVLYAGAHGLSNDLPVVLEAARQIKHRTDITFLLVGDGKDKPGLQEWARQNDLKNVCFLPPIPKNQMAEVLSACDAGLAILKPIELYKTTYPNKVFDYMASGKPVILVIDGVIRQVVENARAGIAVPPGEPTELASAVIHLADNQPMTKQMGQNGQEYVRQHFNRRTFSIMLANLLNQLTHK